MLAEAPVEPFDLGRPRRLPRAALTTVGVPPSRRLEVWEELNARALALLTCRTLGNESFEARGWALQTRRLRLAHIVSGPHVAERMAREIERSPSGAMLFTVVLSGEVGIYDGEGVATLRPGQAVLTDGDVPSMRGFAQGSEQLHLTIPKPVFQEAVGSELLPARQVFDLGDGAPGHASGAALARLMRESLRESGAGDLRSLERDILGLLGAMVVGPRIGDPESQFEAARAFVRQNLSDPSLSASRIAAALGVSERQISRIFRQHGGVARWITDERLDRARAVLASPGRRSVGQVAQQCGFGSQSYFARVFKQRFGVSPRETLDGYSFDDRGRAAV